MADAVLYLDTTHLHPVIDGVWHHLAPKQLPASGRPLTMRCGARGTTEIRPLAERRAHGVPRMCGDCDEIVRAERRIPQLWMKR